MRTQIAPTIGNLRLTAEDRTTDDNDKAVEEEGKVLEVEVEEHRGDTIFHHGFYFIFFNLLRSTEYMLCFDCGTNVTES